MRPPLARYSKLASLLAAGWWQLGAAKAPLPLAERSVSEILDHYTFAGDFSDKDKERHVSKEIFWRYPLIVPKVDFAEDIPFHDPKAEMPATKGAGRAVGHLNLGRTLFLEGKFGAARATWLSARARYGQKYPYHRRDDYFIGYAFMNEALELVKAKGLTMDAAPVRAIMSNAATFLSWAFVVKVDQPDPLVEAASPKGLYNLAATYWRYGRFGGAYGAAETGLNFLRKTGRKEFRTLFHRILAEAHIKNRSYLEAVQELDIAIRQDRDPVEAAAAFARVGDIYFDLNNYELAEDAYALGARIDVDQKQINQAQLVLWGESLFWLGRFSEAQKVLNFALASPTTSGKITRPLGPEYASWASLRIADAYLARHQLEQARLAYYKVGRDFRSTAAGKIALVREACLELPFYKGHNIGHARELLEQAKAFNELPSVIKELGWACQVASYTDLERSPEMLTRVKAFAAAYPNSDFLRSFAEPVRSYQASHIDGFFAAGDPFVAIAFFEQNRKALFPRVAPELARRLFVANANVHRSAAAAEFWGAGVKAETSDLDVLRRAVVAAEMVQKGAKGIWLQRDQAFAKQLERRSWTLAPDALAVLYLQRMRLAAQDSRHLLWMLQLARHFSNVDNSYTCDLEYPLLSQLRAIGGSNVSLVAERNKEIIKAQLPGLFQRDESCALSLLDLEAYELKREGPDVVASTYLSRRDWPLVAGFLHVYWTMSEYVHAEGDTAAARRLWEVIATNGPPTAPEVSFAKARLDPTRTEMEKLWD